MESKKMKTSNILKIMIPIRVGNCYGCNEAGHYIKDCQRKEEGFRNIPRWHGNYY